MRESSTGALVHRDLPAAGIEADRAHVEHLFVVLGHGHPAAQDGPHAGHQLAQAERLGHVVAGAQLEAEHDVDLGVAGGHHDDRHRLQRAHLLAQLDPRQIGQHHVQQDQVGMDPVEEPQRLVPVPGALDGEALAVQTRGQRLAVRLLVVDHQHQRPVVARGGVRGRPTVGHRGGGHRPGSIRPRRLAKQRARERVSEG